MAIWVTGVSAANLLVIAAPSFTQARTRADLGAIWRDPVSKRYSVNDLGQSSKSASSPAGSIAAPFRNGPPTRQGTLEIGALGTTRSDANNAAGRERGILPTPVQSQR
jgi:hypothetical protein